jgi:HipA-like protein
MASAAAVTLLHLSDLHFGRKHRFEQEGLGSLLSRVCEDIDERIVKDGLQPDVVVLSGDFAEYGKREEFDQASALACGLRAHLKLPARRFVVVPGNHDINWKKSEAYFADRAGDDLAPIEPYFPKLVHYKRFFDAFYEGESGIAFTEEEPWSLFEMPDLGVVVAGLDSAFAESHRPEDHHAFLGERQIRAFAGKLKPYKERGFLRIGVMHHDPFDKRGGARAEQDQRDFRRWLVPELNLLLHGDIHEETLRQLARDVPALGVGSAAVGVDERGPDVSNEYQILVVRTDGIDRHLRAWVSDQKRWVASPRADAAGESGKTFVRADFDAVAALGQRAAPAPAFDLAAIVAQYRAAMVRYQGAPTVFDLLGVGDGDGDGAGGLDFLRLFVPQDASRDLPRPERSARDRWDGAPPDEVAAETRTPPPPDWRIERTRTVDELFDQRRLLFIGAPGAGKSALTRWLLLKLCVPGERVAGLPDDLVPVRVELRRFDEEHRRAGATYSVFDHIAREQADRHGPLTADHLRTLAEQGRVLWLFDGLDEVADPQRRREMAERIAGLLDAHKDCRAVATSRVAGADVVRPILEGAAFQTYALQEFTAEQRDRFLDAWHELVFQRDPPTGTARRARMAAAIEAAPSLQELCKNPLLCALLAYLHREESLPRRRHLLYQKVLERMAEHWDANKGLPPRPSAERFELEDKLAFLRALAWKMQSEPRTAGNAIGRSELEDFTADFCEKRWGQPKDAARRRGEAFIYQLQARNGVLAYLGADTYGFAHRAFLEHLAASEAVERFRKRQWELEDLAGVFAVRWRAAAWEETLLLTCGLLQEDGEPGAARVVRVLQAIGEGRPAVIYGSLNNYLAFCIKALGELPQLERWVPRDFARAINDILIILIDEGFLPEYTFMPAFQRCAGRWPEVRALVQAMTKRTKKEKYAGGILSFYPTLIAAGGKAFRAELVVEALGSDKVTPYRVCTEAARLGPWSGKEVDLILDACCHRDQQDQFNVAASIATAKGSRWRDQERPIAILKRLAHEANTEDLRVRSAWILLRARCHIDAAKEILLQATRSTDKYAAKQATLCLVDQGFGELVVGPLAQFARTDGSAFLELAKLADRLPGAKDLLPEVLVAIRGASDPDVLLDAARTTMQHGFRFFEENEILERWRSIESPDAKAGRIGWFYFVQGTEQLQIRAWLELLAESSKWASVIQWDSNDMTPQQAGPLLLDLWRRLFDLKQIHIAIPLAANIIRLSPGGELQARAERVRDWALHETANEAVLVQAAQNFRETHPPAQKVLEQLAESANDEWERFSAARFAGNLRSLNHLAGKTTNDNLRDSIRHALDLYGEVNSLLQVGKLRRARVRFEGRDAGILEELTKVGNGTRFHYNLDYDGPPIAPNMPLGRTYENIEALLPFFANLLPEGALYEQTARRLGLKRNDRLGVLLRVGADTMGAIEILPLEPA